MRSLSEPLLAAAPCADAPWCEIRRSHASFAGVRTHFGAVAKERYQAASEAAAADAAAPRLVKGRSEPCQMIQVAEALAAARGVDVLAITNAAHANSKRMFFKVSDVAGTGTGSQPTSGSGASESGPSST